MSRSLVVDVFDAILVESDGSVIGTTTLQSGNIDVAVSEVEVRGGKSNALLANLHVQRDINIELVDVEWKPEWIAKQLGTSITSGATEAYSMPKWYSVIDLDGDASGTALGFKLDNTPLVSNSGLKIFGTDGVEVNSNTGYTIATDTVTILKAGVRVGDVFEVRTYKYATPVGTQTLNFESDKFATGAKLVLSTLETDENEEHLFELQYIFENAIPNGSFAIQTSSEKKESTQSLKLKIVKPSNSTIVGKLLRIPLSAS